MSDYKLTALISIPQEAGYYFPERHFQYVSGKPLYKLMIEKLEEIDAISTIIVNTDSGRIQNDYSRSRKVKVVNAYQGELGEIEMELTSDKVTTAMLEYAEGEHFLQLGAIFPFLKQDTIGYVISTYDTHVANPEEDYQRYGYDSVFTNRILNRRYYDSDTDFVREDRPNTLLEDGILHVFNRTAFVANGNRKVGKRPYAYTVNEIENWAIDSEENYRLAVYIDEHRHFFPIVR